MKKRAEIKTWTEAELVASCRLERGEMIKSTHFSHEMICPPEIGKQQQEQGEEKNGKRTQ